jgi:hypothetical protein
VCGGSGERTPQISDANLPDALLLWMGVIQQRLDKLETGQTGGVAALMLGILIGIVVGHWLF